MNEMRSAYSKESEGENLCAHFVRKEKSKIEEETCFSELDCALAMALLGS